MTEIVQEKTADEILAEEYKAKSINSKFKQVLAYGAGAAMVFGLVNALSGGLMSAVTHAFGSAALLASGAGIAPVLGLVALGVIGMGLIYLSARFTAENTVLDNQLQAKQIAVARGKAPEIAPVVTQPAPTIPATNSIPDAPASTTPVTDSILAKLPDNANALPINTVSGAKQAAPLIARAAANENIAPDASWQEKITGTDNAAQMARA